MIETSSHRYEFTGRLEFISLHKPIQLHNDQEIIDVWPHCDTFFRSVNGGGAIMDDSKTHIEIKADADSEAKFKYKNEDGSILGVLSTAVSMSNTMVYLEHTLQRLNGRKVIVEISKSKIRFEADKTDEVYGVYYTHGNSCLLPKDEAIRICQPNTCNTCIFLTSSARGFECSKFDSSTARIILDRFGEKMMNSTRIGNCEILGRNEPPAPVLKLEDYPRLMDIVARKNEYIGWKLQDSGDSMDRRMFGNEKMETVVKDITFTLDDDKVSASFTVIGDRFTCGFNVKYGGGVKSFAPGDKAIEFYGYMGQSFMIYES